MSVANAHTVRLLSLFQLHGINIKSAMAAAAIHRHYSGTHGLLTLALSSTRTHTLELRAASESKPGKLNGQGRTL